MSDVAALAALLVCAACGFITISTPLPIPILSGIGCIIAGILAWKLAEGN